MAYGCHSLLSPALSGCWMYQQNCMARRDIQISFFLFQAAFGFLFSHILFCHQSMVPCQRRVYMYFPCMCAACCYVCSCACVENVYVGAFVCARSHPHVFSSAQLRES